MSIGTATATVALSKLDFFQTGGFRAIVLDERGREWSLDQLEAEAANEASSTAPAADPSTLAVP